MLWKNIAPFPPLFHLLLASFGLHEATFGNSGSCQRCSNYGTLGWHRGLLLKLIVDHSWRHGLKKWAINSRNTDNIPSVKLVTCWSSNLFQNVTVYMLRWNLRKDTAAFGPTIVVKKYCPVVIKCRDGINYLVKETKPLSALNSAVGVPECLQNSKAFRNWVLEHKSLSDPQWIHAPYAVIKLCFLLTGLQCSSYCSKYGWKVCNRCCIRPYLPVYGRAISNSCTVRQNSLPLKN